MLRIVEVGVGCGAISVALDLARENATRHGVVDRVTLLEGYILKTVPGAIDILVSNPPYIPSTELPNLAREIINHEPRVALDGGPDGMSVIDQLIEQAKDHLSPGAAMFIEIGWDQGEVAISHARHLWPEAQACITPDLAGLRSPVGVTQPV